MVVREPPAVPWSCRSRGAATADLETPYRAGRWPGSQHRTASGAALDKVLFLHILRVYDSDGGSDASILIHQRGFEDCDGMFWRDGPFAGRCPPCRKHGAFCRSTLMAWSGLSVLLQLDHLATGIQHLDVPPGIHIDLLDAGAKNVLGSE